jgi:parallel beta-helix repeat protein
MFESPGNIEFFNNTVNGGFSPTILGGKKHTFFNYGYFITGENISILNNSAINTSGEGFHMENISNADVAHNFAIDNNGNGFIILNSTNVIFQSNILKNNDFFLSKNNLSRLYQNSFFGSVYIENSKYQDIFNNTINSSATDGAAVFNSSFINLQSNYIFNSKYSGFKILFSSDLQLQNNAYCYSNFLEGGRPYPIVDLQYSNSSNITIKNITCDHSYPEGLCSNPCPEITTQEPATTPTKIHQGCFSLAILLSICLGVFSSVLKVRA